jgi:hypothetical protein
MCVITKREMKFNINQITSLDKYWVAPLNADPTNKDQAEES